MTAFIVLAVVAMLFLLFLGSAIWSRYSRRTGAIQRQSAQLTPVDLEAFDNLTDPEEEQFLRTNLSPKEFRRVQRLRIRAAKLYVAALSQNAGVLMAAGQSARLNSNPDVAATGQELVQKAIRLKVWCLFSLMRMDTAFFFPVLLSPSNKLANQYMLISYMAANLPERVAA